MYLYIDSNTSERNAHARTHAHEGCLGLKRQEKVGKEKTCVQKHIEMKEEETNEKKCSGKVPR